MRRTALAALHEARGARWMNTTAGDPRPLLATRGGVPRAPGGCRPGGSLHRGRLRSPGGPAELAARAGDPGDQPAAGRKGRYAAILNAQGHMSVTRGCFALPDALILTCRGTAAPIAEYLDRFLIMEASRDRGPDGSVALLSLQGPLARRAASWSSGRRSPALELWDIREGRYDDEPLYVARLPRCGEDG